MDQLIGGVRRGLTPAIAERRYGRSVALRRTAVDTLTSDLGRIRVYRDDLQEMVEILREAGITCRIRVDDYEVDEIDDLAELAGRGVYRIREFVISDGANRVGFFINGRRAILAVRDPDLALRGATAEVQRIAQRCRRHFPRSAIDTRARAEAPTFWQRSKDDVWIAAVSGVIFLVVGYLLGRLG